MSNDNKTLADVQPGARVRLEDQLPPLPKAGYVTGGDFGHEAHNAFTPEQMREYALAALSAQPSPGGQGDARMPFEAWAKGGGFDVSKFKGIYNSLETRAAWEAWLYWQRLATRQPVGEPVGTVHSGKYASGMPWCEVEWHIPQPAGTKLYAAQPAQAVDLGEMRKCADQAVEFINHGYGGHARRKIQELLALIDSQAVGNGK